MNIEAANTEHPRRESVIPNPKARLRDRLQEVMRFNHYAVRTEETCWHCIRGSILFHRKHHPRELRADEVRGFWFHLATAGGVAAGTQNEALNALVILCREVPGFEPGDFGPIEPVPCRRRLPVMLNPLVIHDRATPLAASGVRHSFGQLSVSSRP